MSYTPTDEQTEVWAKWVSERPPEIRAVAERFFPWREYRYLPTGQRARIYSISEPEPPRYPGVTITAVMWMDLLPEVTKRTVFGLDPADFEEIP